MICISFFFFHTQDDDDAVPEETRLADDLAADAKGLGNADPQSKLVKDILSRQAEQEVARKGNTQVIFPSSHCEVMYAAIKFDHFFLFFVVFFVCFFVYLFIRSLMNQRILQWKEAILLVEVEFD